MGPKNTLNYLTFFQILVNKYGPQEKNPFGDNPVFEKPEDVINYGKQIYENIREAFR